MKLHMQIDVNTFPTLCLQDAVSAGVQHLGGKKASERWMQKICQQTGLYWV